MFRQYEVLYKAFDLFNEHYFDNELPSCVITLQKKRENNYGHFVSEPTWFNQKSDDETYEININPINMNRKPVEILSTLLHECVHYYCTLNNLKDIKSNKHSTVYKEVAESNGLHVEYDDKLGWAITELTEESIELIKDLIEEYKNDFWYMYVPKKEVKKTQFKFICPQCGAKIYGKMETDVYCGQCGVQLEMEQVEYNESEES